MNQGGGDYTIISILPWIFGGCFIFKEKDLPKVRRRKKTSSYQICAKLLKLNSTNPGQIQSHLGQIYSHIQQFQSHLGQIQFNLEQIHLHVRKIKTHIIQIQSPYGQTQSDLVKIYLHHDKPILVSKKLNHIKEKSSNG